jgi:hypothetical protein
VGENERMDMKGINRIIRATFRWKYTKKNKLSKPSYYTQREYIADDILGVLAAGGKWQ